jgi:hypothetical protein
MGAETQRRIKLGCEAVVALVASTIEVCAETLMVPSATRLVSPPVAILVGVVALTLAPAAGSVPVSVVVPLWR